ncbi:type II toxin-antitoxin system RelE/ParE family toxin [Aliirhizobium smilacinae]|uniref:Type II toxin-antitoxin system RelE/ParE family toxin n=1 Tax=Aliirhizobium smilacinae TaxID=1395944 RepID=A0A5C4XP27_9HYPH|nr:type II toxin-antitoxin system RelE/ParE family toxin [Rhizobium smilacinae]TNM65172.1 type II toxin-antitoxin system RelE/ParE family toxin [Rhizobium smilacinae]
MMRAPVTYRPNARKAIDAIFLYVLEASHSLPTAERFTNRILDRCESIGDAPFGGAARPDLGVGIRAVPFEGRAVILYRVKDEAKEISNIFYRGRDYHAIMANKP